MSGFDGSPYRRWLEENATPTVFVYSGLIVALLPAFHFVLTAIPGIPPDSLLLRLAAAAVSALVAAGLLLFPALRKYSADLQLINILPTALVVPILVVDSGNNSLYIASSLLVALGAQQAYFRTRDLVITACLACGFEAVYSAARGIFDQPTNLIALAIVTTGYLIAVICGAIRIRIQQNELHSRLEAQRMKAELEEREAALRHSQDRLAEVHAITHLGNLERDLRTGSVEWSQELLRIFDLPVDTPPQALRDLYERSIHPDDAARVRHEIEASYASGLPFGIDHRIVLREGTVRWVHLRGKHEYDDGTATPQRMVAAVLDVTARKEFEERLARLARVDVLTGLPNREALLVHLRQLLHTDDGAPPAPGATLFLDLDRFKDINDTFGHALGDTLLHAVAERFSILLPPNALLARWGGDEFVVVLSNIGGRDDAVAVAEKLTRATVEPFFVDEYELVVTTSAGIALFPEHGTDVSVLVRNADTAMYRAKESDSENYAFYEPQMHAAAVLRHHVQTELRKAPANDSLVLHFQPIIDSASTKLVGAEALLRWQRPDGMLAQPADFIPIAEETGLIIPIGTWVLRAGCRQICAWQDAGRRLRLSINVSARQFTHPEFLDVLRMVLRETGADPKLLDIEITETALMTRVDEALAALHELHTIGVSVTIDDFGTGYSSFAYLKRFPLNALKLDRTFVTGMDRRDDREIVSSIITIAHTLGMTVTGEGVETRLQFEILAGARCDFIQGFFISHPLPVAQFDEYVRDSGEPMRVT